MGTELNNEFKDELKDELKDNQGGNHDNGQNNDQTDDQNNDQIDDRDLIGKLMEEDEDFRASVEKFNSTEQIGKNPNPHKLVENLNEASTFVRVLILNEMNSVKFPFYRPLSEEEHKKMLDFLKSTEGTPEYEAITNFMYYWNNLKCIVSTAFSLCEMRLINYFNVFQATFRLMKVAEVNAQTYGTDDPYYKANGITQSEESPITTLENIVDKFNEEFIDVNAYAQYLLLIGNTFGVWDLHGLYITTLDSCNELFFAMKNIERIDMGFLYGAHHTLEESIELERKLRDIAPKVLMPSFANEDIISAFQAAQDMGLTNYNQVFAFSAILKNAVLKKRAQDKAEREASKAEAQKKTETQEKK